MAISVIQKLPATSYPSYVTSNTVVSTALSGVSAGNILVAVFTGFLSGGCRPTFSDNKGNSWSEAVYSGIPGNTGYGISIGVALVEAGKDGSVTVSATVGGNASMDLGVFEVSGATLTSYLTNVATDNSSTITSGQVSPSGNAIYIAVGSPQGGGAVTTFAGSPWIQGHKEDWDYAMYYNSEYQIGSGAKTATWTLNTGLNNAGIILALNEAATTPDPGSIVSTITL